MKIKNLFFVFVMILLIGFVSAGDYRFQNLTGTDLMTVYGATGNVGVLGNVTSSGWFKGLFNWVVGSSSSNYLTFNGSQLDFSEAVLNGTINNSIDLRQGLLNVNSSNYWDDYDVPEDIVYSDLYTNFWDANLDIGNYNFSVDTSTFFVNSNTGNVGINTASPGQKLDLYNGNFRVLPIDATDNISVNSPDVIFRGKYDSNATAVGIVQATRDITLRNIMDWDSGNGDYRLAVLDNAGAEFVTFEGDTQRVGIATSTPQNTLNVVGDGNFTTALYVNEKNLETGYDFATNGTYYLASNPDSFIDWAKATNGTLATWAQAMNGTLMSQATYNTNYTTLMLQSTFDSNYSTNDPIYRSWSLNYSDYLTTKAYALNDSLWTSNYTSATLSLPNNLAVAKNFSVDTSDFFVNSNTGNVGIGTTGPLALLDVYSTGTSDTRMIKITQPSLANGNRGSLLMFGKADSAYNMGYIGFIPNADSALNKITLGLHSADDLMVIQKNGNVGVGTTSPQNTLNVIGTGNFTSNLSVSNQLNMFYNGTEMVIEY